MDIFWILLAGGLIGIVVMASMGHLHVGGHGHGASGHGAHGHGAHGHGGHGSHSGQSHGQAAKANLKNFFSLSPIDVFSYCAGAGAVGLLVRPYLSGVLLAVAAIGGALVFDLGFIRTLANFLQRWSADPSAGLEGTVAQPGEAVTNFDAKGQGVIRLTLDGQIVQLLATLESTEIQAGVKVKKGDSLMVVQVDGAKNKCLVTRELEDGP